MPKTPRSILNLGFRHYTLVRGLGGDGAGKYE